LDEPKKAMKEYQNCYDIVSSMFGEDHPATLQYNSNLFDMYHSLKENKEENLAKCKKIIEKNLEISREAMGKESIH